MGGLTGGRHPGKRGVGIGGKMAFVKWSRVGEIANNFTVLSNIKKEREQELG